jgi:stress-induced-phosphoprotein 1
MRDYPKAIEAIGEAEEHDADGSHRAEIQQQVYKCQQALYTQRAGESEEETLNRAMRDPEIAVSRLENVVAFWMALNLSLCHRVS